MKYLRGMNGHNTRYEIEKICHKFSMENFTINSDGSIDVDGSVYLNSYGLTELPLSFDKVSGNFECYNNNITTLKGSPRIVDCSFICDGNRLVSLEYGPVHVGGRYSCNFNDLTSLKYLPVNINQLDCKYNHIVIPNGFPSTLDRHNMEGNSIHNIIKLFPNYNMFMKSTDYSYIRGNKIDLSRFKEACEEFNITVPSKIEGYEYI